MQCPYCNTEMIVGTLFSVADHGIYRLPNHSERDFKMLNRKNVESRNGIFLDKLTKIGFIARKRPDSYYCSSCKIFITKL